MDGDSRSDLELWRAVRAGDDEAWAALVRRWADLLWGCCRKVFDEAECTREFPALIRRLGAERAAMLSDWDGRAGFSTFLGLKAADGLAERITTLLAEDSRRGWVAFERFFADGLGRMVRRRLEGDDAEDILQELRLRLMADGGSPVRLYDGRGSFTGYVRRVAHNLMEDILRARDGRRREPDAIRKLGDLERRAYNLVHIQGYRADQLPDVLSLPAAEALPALDRAEAALGHRVVQPAPRMVPLTLVDGDGREWERPLPHWAPSPEEALSTAQERNDLERACAALAAAMARLPALARQYLRLRFLEVPPLAPRHIARRLGLPVDELYRRRKSWEALLLDELRTEGVEKFPLPPV